MIFQELNRFCSTYCWFFSFSLLSWPVTVSLLRLRTLELKRMKGLLTIFYHLNILCEQFRKVYSTVWKNIFSTRNTDGSYKKIWGSIIFFINREKWSLFIIEMNLAFSAILKESTKNNRKKKNWLEATSLVWTNLTEDLNSAFFPSRHKPPATQAWTTAEQIQVVFELGLQLITRAHYLLCGLKHNLFR